MMIIESNHVPELYIDTPVISLQSASLAGLGPPLFHISHIFTPSLVWSHFPGAQSTVTFLQPLNSGLPFTPLTLLFRSMITDVLFLVLASWKVDYMTVTLVMF